MGSGIQDSKRRTLTANGVGSLMREARQRSGLNRTQLARLGGTSRGAIDQIEKGDRMPQVDTLLRLLDLGDVSLRVHIPQNRTAELESRQTLASFCAAVDATDDRWMWRTLISDFVANEFVPASSEQREQMLEAEPEAFAHAGWNCFVAALAEHLAIHSKCAPPGWVSNRERVSLPSFWWPVHGNLPSTRAAALANSPASFKARLVLVDQVDLPTIRP